MHIGIICTQTEMLIGKEMKRYPCIFYFVSSLHFECYFSIHPAMDVIR